MSLLKSIATPIAICFLRSTSFERAAGVIKRAGGFDGRPPPRTFLFILPYDSKKSERFCFSSDINR